MSEQAHKFVQQNEDTKLFITINNKHIGKQWIMQGGCNHCIRIHVVCTHILGFPLYIHVGMQGFFINKMSANGRYSRSYQELVHVRQRVSNFQYLHVHHNNIMLGNTSDDSLVFIQPIVILHTANSQMPCTTWQQIQTIQHY